MPDVESDRLRHRDRFRNSLRRKWFVLVGMLTAGLAFVFVCLHVRETRQQAEVEFFAHRGAVIDTRQQQQRWLYKLIVATLGEEHAGGPVVVTGIDLSETAVTDADLQHLNSFAGLEFLRLDHTQITDAGLQHLSGLTSLQQLHLDNTRVTQAGVDELRTQLPGCEIAVTFE